MRSRPGEDQAHGRTKRRTESTENKPAGEKAGANRLQHRPTAGATPQRAVGDPKNNARRKQREKKEAQGEREQKEHN
jgi:hypothetical protein